MGQDGILYGLDPSAGTVRARAHVGAPANHFPTPGIGAGLLLASSDDRVVSFRAPSTAALPATSPTTTTTEATPTTTRAARAGTAASAPQASKPGTNPGLIVAAALAGVAVVGVAAWLERRRRRAPR